jgi:8-oxo-dGTP pyrophosphatase MutT (NUDIX family)
VTPWRVHGEQSLHESTTVRLALADVELTDGTRGDHYVIRIPFQVVSLVLSDADGRLLLIWRYRFIPDVWCWDVPAGKVADGEPAIEAAARAAVEETGWRPRSVRLLGHYHPSPGISDQRFSVCVGTGAERVADANPNDVEKLEWVAVDRVRDLIRTGQVDGLSLTSLLWALDAGEFQNIRF